MSDERWKESLKEITDPYELLNELVDLEMAVRVDAYYSDLYEALIAQAIRILDNRPKITTGG